MTGHTPPLSRLVEDQPEPWAREMRALDSELVFAEDREPEGFVEEPSVSGRSQPRPGPVPDGFAHDMRFKARFIWDENITVPVAQCQPCAWQTRLDNGHDLPDLISLYVQHAGLEAAKTLCIETLARLGNSDVLNPPDDDDDGGDDITDPLADDGPEHCATCGASAEGVAGSRDSAALTNR